MSEEQSMKEEMCYLRKCEGIQRMTIGKGQILTEETSYNSNNTKDGKAHLGR